MKNVLEIIEELRNTNKRNDKIEILEKYRNNKDWIKLLKYTYDTNRHYQFSKIDNVSECSKIELEDYLNAIFSILDLLNSREITGSSAYETLSCLRYNLPDEYKNLLDLILRRNLDIGVSVKTFNKVYDNLIPEFPVQLAVKKPLKKKDFPVYLEEKLDGVRILVEIGNEEIIGVYTRKGNEILLPSLNKALNLFVRFNAKYRNYILDGELISKKFSRKKLSGFLNSQMQDPKLDIDDSHLVYYVFDIITKEEWETRKSVILSERKKRLDALFDRYYSDTIIKVPYEKVDYTNRERIDEKFHEVLQNGKEGIMIKPVNREYEFKRSDAFRKLKAENTIDLRVAGVTEGSGKYKNMIGSLQCETDDGKLRVSVGSGLTDKDRDLPKDYYIGRIVEVKYNEFITDDNGNLSLFLPVFNGIRFDKDETDLIKGVKND